jgi:hypothetical protein
MYERRKAEIEEMRERFDREVAERSMGARVTGEKYLELLSALIDKVETGPVTDPDVANIDTTGSLHRAEEYEEWAERERHRVRRALTDIG